MRRFLLLVHRVPPDGDFSLNDLANGGGRMDEVAQAVVSAFLTSGDIRRDTVVELLFVRDPGGVRRVELLGSGLRYLNPDERSTAALIKNALARYAGRPGRPIEASPGVRVGPGSLPEDLETFLRNPGALWLEERGEPLRSRALGTEVAAVLGDVFDPDPTERAILERSGVPRVSVGPRPLRASQCVIVLQNELDLREVGPRPGDTPG